MIATNHALAGALIGLTVGNPLIAVPAALLSHFVMDALPHFDTGTFFGGIERPGFQHYLLGDAIFCGLIVLALFASQPAHWQSAALCAFIATAPDFLSLRKFLAIQRGKPFQPNVVERFTKRIQWFERLSGWPVEATWLVAGICLLWQFL